MNVPALRFPEFKGEWKNQRINNTTTLIQSGLSRLLKDSDVGLPVLRSNNITDCKLDYSDMKYWYIKDPQGADTKNYFLKNNDLLINFINSMSQIGKVALYKNTLKRDVIITTNIMRLQFVENVLPSYVFYQLCTNQFKKYILSVTKPAVNQASFTVVDLKNYSFHLPEKDEQQKIANFLTTVDKKITQLTEKKTLLEEYRKGCMQQLFSQQIRFKDDEGNDYPDWENKKIGEVGSFAGGGTPDTNRLELWKGDIPWISSSDTEENTIKLKKVTRFISSEGVNSSASKIIPKNSVLIVSRVGVGKIAVNEEELCTSQDFLNLTPSSGIDNIFLALLLLSKRNSLLSLCQGTSIKGLSYDSLKMMKIPLPSSEEQQKIANFLSALDKKIDSVQQQIEHTQQFKKGLLQQMFV